MNKAAFLDRDGVINRKAPKGEYITRWEDMQFLPGVAEAIALSSRRVNGVAEIRVTDKGPGIAEARQKRLFQPFYTTRVDKGTGLGLWVSNEIVERTGGSLTIDSNPAVRPGSTFLVSLPLAVA